jgi:hypothetical protein
MIGQSNAVGFDQYCDVAVFAKGSTSIVEWAPGGALFAGATNCAGPRAETVIWFQGETDAMPRHGAQGYSEALTSLLGALRDDLGPNLELILIHTVTGCPGDRAIWEAKEAAGVRTVETADLERVGIHLTEDAKAELCGRIF